MVDPVPSRATVRALVLDTDLAHPVGPQDTKDETDKDGLTAPVDEPQDGIQRSPAGVVDEVDVERIKTSIHRAYAREPDLCEAPVHRLA